jgi:hypothetical protein
MQPEALAPLEDYVSEAYEDDMNQSNFCLVVGVGRATNGQVRQDEAIGGRKKQPQHSLNSSKICLQMLL